MVVLKLFWKKWNLKALGLTEWLCLSAAFSGLLLMARVLVTWELTYHFLPWNLFLAFIPYAITRWMSARPDLFEHRLKRFALRAIWMLFI